MRYVCLITFATLFSTVPPVLADRIGVVRGELTCKSCSSYSGMVIDVADTAHQHVAATSVGSNGSFELHNVREGAYRVVVRNLRGEVIHQDVLHINAHGPVEIAIPQQNVERPVSGTISVNRLKHKVPKQARKEYEKADKSLKNGDLKASLQHLLRATEIDPEYMEAHNNLGSRYIMLNQYDLALAAFRRALELDPDAGMVQLNMAVALMAVGDHKEAEAVARRALQKDPANAKGRYLLGLALYTQKKYSNEALALLEQSEEQFPNAKLAVAAIHAMHGEPMRARTELEAYMTMPNATNREQAKSMLAQLKSND